MSNKDNIKETENKINPEKDIQGEKDKNNNEKNENKDGKNKEEEKDNNIIIENQEDEKEEDTKNINNEDSTGIIDKEDVEHKKEDTKDEIEKDIPESILNTEQDNEPEKNLGEKESQDFPEEEVYRNDSSGLIEQGDGIVEWHIENIFNEDGKRYSKRELKSNPPLLIIKDNYGDEATFILTEKLALHLRDSMNLVYNAYYNIETKGYKEDATKWWMRKTLPLLVIAVLLAISILLSFIQ